MKCIIIALTLMFSVNGWSQQVDELNQYLQGILSNYENRSIEWNVNIFRKGDLGRAKQVEDEYSDKIQSLDPADPDYQSKYKKLNQEKAALSADQASDMASEKIVKLQYLNPKQWIVTETFSGAGTSQVPPIIHYASSDGFTYTVISPLKLVQVGRNSSTLLMDLIPADTSLVLGTLISDYRPTIANDGGKLTVTVSVGPNHVKVFTLNPKTMIPSAYRETDSDLLRFEVDKNEGGYSVFTYDGIHPNPILKQKWTLLENRPLASNEVINTEYKIDPKFQIQSVDGKPLDIKYNDIHK